MGAVARSEGKRGADVVDAGGDGISDVPGAKRRVTVRVRAHRMLPLEQRSGGGRGLQLLFKAPASTAAWWTSSNCHCVVEC